MKTTTTLAAAALTALTLVSLGTTDPRQTGQSVTSPHRTVIQAAPSEPLCPEMKARCAPIPPAPMTRMTVEVPDVPKTEIADEYAQAWEEVVR